MSGLGHFLEDEGLATVSISLVRMHTEKVQPPRALWVPFELGRPLGNPQDPVLQRRVLEQALSLLEVDEGPVVLVDFVHEGEGTEPDQNWTPPFQTEQRSFPNAVGALALLREEIGKLKPEYEAARKLKERTTFGIAQLPIDACAAHIASFVDAPHEVSPRSDLSAAMALRFAVDDLKTFYMEVGARNGRPSSHQLGEWFWCHTAAGAILISLRRDALESTDERFKTVGSSFLVPRIWVNALGE